MEDGVEGEISNVHLRRIQAHLKAIGQVELGAEVAAANLVSLTNSQATRPMLLSEQDFLSWNWYTGWVHCLVVWGGAYTVSTCWLQTFGRPGPVKSSSGPSGRSDSWLSSAAIGSLPVHWQALQIRPSEAWSFHAFNWSVIWRCQLSHGLCHHWHSSGALLSYPRFDQGGSVGSIGSVPCSSGSVDPCGTFAVLLLFIFVLYRGTVIIDLVNFNVLFFHWFCPIFLIDLLSPDWKLD